MVRSCVSSRLIFRLCTVLFRFLSSSGRISRCAGAGILSVILFRLRSCFSGILYTIMGTAVLLSRILRVLLVFPLMVAPVTATIVWQLMLNSSVGIVEKLFKALYCEDDGDTIDYPTLMCA